MFLKTKGVHNELEREHNIRHSLSPAKDFPCSTFKTSTFWRLFMIGDEPTGGQIITCCINDAFLQKFHLRSIACILALSKCT